MLASLKEVKCRRGKVELADSHFAGDLSTILVYVFFHKLFTPRLKFDREHNCYYFRVTSLNVSLVVQKLL